MDDNETRKISEYYDALSQSYDELYGDEQSQKHLLVEELLNRRKFRVAIDVGCGTAAFLRQTNQLYQRAVGIDLSREMLRKAQSRNLPNVDLVRADASSLPIRERVVDLLVSVSVAESESTLPIMLAELRRIAGESAALVLTAFQGPETGRQLTSEEVEYPRKLSDRENLYLVRFNPRRKSEALPVHAGAL